MYFNWVFLGIVAYTEWLIEQFDFQYGLFNNSVNFSSYNNKFDYNFNVLCASFISEGFNKTVK